MHCSGTFLEEWGGAMRLFSCPLFKRPAIKKALRVYKANQSFCNFWILHAKRLLKVALLICVCYISIFCLSSQLLLYLNKMEIPHFIERLFQNSQSLKIYICPKANQYQVQIMTPNMGLSRITVTFYALGFMNFLEA